MTYAKIEIHYYNVRFPSVRALKKRRYKLKNFVVKTAVKTLLIVLAVLVVAFVIFNFAFPQHMASFAEKIGNYDMAVRYASLRYSYTGDTDDLARCFEDAILADDNELIIEYGDQFFEKDDHAQVMVNLSLDREIDYYDLFGGGLTRARYETDNFSGALELALDLYDDTKSLTYSCPLTSLAASVVNNNDTQNAPALLDALEGISPTNDGGEEILSSLVGSLGELSN